MPKGKKNTKTKQPKQDRMSKLIEQAREPLGLIETLKEEGLARATYLLGIAAGVAENVTKDKLYTQLKEITTLMGIATREDIKALQEEIRELRGRIAALEDRSNGEREELVEDDEEEDEMREEFDVKKDLEDLEDLEEEDDEDEDEDNYN